MSIHRRPTLVAAGLLVLLISGLRAQDHNQTVPADLKPLLAAPQSDMRMVALRYTLDRTTLSGNYANGTGRGRGGGGRGRGAAAPDPSAPPPAPLVPVSPARIARLKRFDMAWQAALGKLDAAKPPPAAKGDPDAANAATPTRFKTTEDETLSMAQALAAAPFAPKLVQLVEARIRVQDVDSARARRHHHRRHQEVARLTSDPPPLNKDQATLAATRSISCAPSRPSGSTSTTPTIRCSRGGTGIPTSAWTRR